ncbi:conserved hypothetical protein [Lodderomyces elongisporus NRRL YB-4239]|uniref:Ribosomal RNA-processing protein 1 n=1 Tax=Lodderomyces elongisporus (strain ATCC 11503 / CBS 2605 / JCM 1781 / NBRC 1676 / NRRL YB-4239) TaxID=379508 RepID=A5E062_LODEL|nr:conserved hypothetical protein [Lodderomyces elongisporus NRRL YB-4239]
MSLTSAFVKKLASNDKPTRDAALEALRKYLASKTLKSGNSLSLLDMEKLWRGLYFSMWFCDRPKAQERLAESLGQLYLENIKSVESFLLFTKAFNLIMIKEWASIDQWRIDKYYLLIRRVLRHNFQYLKKNQWDLELVKKWTQVMMETILSGGDKVPVALPYHLCDIFLDELELIMFADIEDREVDENDPEDMKQKLEELNKEKIAIANEVPIRELIEPFTKLSKEAKLKTLREKTKEDVLDNEKLVEWGVVRNSNGNKGGNSEGSEEDEDDEDEEDEDEEDEWKGF